jgi:hypothetical protein
MNKLGGNCNKKGVLVHSCIDKNAQQNILNASKAKSLEKLHVCKHGILHMSPPIKVLR